MYMDREQENYVHSRRHVEQHIEELIALLDALDGDPDLEDGADDEPGGRLVTAVMAKPATRSRKRRPCSKPRGFAPTPNARGRRRRVARPNASFARGLVAAFGDTGAIRPPRTSRSSARTSASTW